jgi:hypothetical protein
MNEQDSDWIHARVPEELQESLKLLLERGHTKTEIAKAGIRILCKQDGIKVPA